MQMKMLFGLWWAFVALNVQAQPWIYYDVRNPRDQFVLESGPPRAAWMDVATDAKVCEATDKFWCFAAGDLRFAIPKSFKGGKDAWNHEGIDYRVTGSARRPILGRNYTTFFIEPQGPGPSIRFHFTREAGLIAISTTGVDRGMLLILAGKCGFGAPRSCKST